MLEGSLDEAAARDLGLVEYKHELMRAVGALPPRQRAVLVLRYFEDLSESQTSELLGWSIGTVKSTASRALDRLRRDLPPASDVARRPEANFETNLTLHLEGEMERWSDGAMNNQLESDLREGFAGRAAQVPPDSSVRLRTLDFQPRTSRFSTRLTVGSLTGLAAATGAVVSVVILGGAPPAFAGWSADPSAATAPSTRASACEAQLTNGRIGGSAAGGRWTILDTDVRGPFTVMVFQNGESDATCFTGPSFTVVNAADTADGSGHASGSMSTSVKASGHGAGTARASTGASASMLNGTSTDGAAPSIPGMTVSHLLLAAAGGGTYTLVDGQLASGVTAVNLVRTDGSRVRATSGNGWFVAWWPTASGVSSAEVHSTSGPSTEAFTTLATASPPSPGSPGSPVPPGSGGASCGASGPAGTHSACSGTGNGLTTTSAP